MYVVQLTDGRKLRHHIDQLRQRWADSSLESCTEPDAIPDFVDKQRGPPDKEVSVVEPITDPELGQPPTHEDSPSDINSPDSLEKLEIGKHSFYYAEYAFG
ncbi:UNVERIFIED_CONTAM: hypothetical protein K2H54_062051 [Gekko kuhli]